MAIFGWRKKQTKVQGFAEQDNSGQWLQYFKQYHSDFFGNGKLETFDGTNAYELACNLAEVFIPIDAIADRAASIEYRLVYKDTLEEFTPSPNLARLIEQPNPFDRLSDIVYKSVFSELSSGISYTYTKTPDSIKNPTYDNISNIWVLKPNVTSVKIKKEVPNPFLIKNKEELIDKYITFFMYKHEIDPRYIVQRTALGLDERMQAHSPLNKARRNINNLLAVYHARYNVYAKNGNAGILSRDTGNTRTAIEEAVDPVTRDMILADLQNRNGLTGDRNFIGISSIPMKFVKTLGTIAELQPFEETEADMVAIGGVYGVGKYLLPLKEGTTFTNQKDAEKHLWQNVVKGVCEDKARDLTKSYYLPDNVIFYPIFDNVEVLQEDKKTALESDSILISNLQALQEAGQNVSQAFTNLTDKYNG